MLRSSLGTVHSCPTRELFNLSCLALFFAVKFRCCNKTWRWEILSKADLLKLQALFQATFGNGSCTPTYHFDDLAPPGNVEVTQKPRGKIEIMELSTESKILLFIKWVESYGISKGEFNKDVSNRHLRLQQ